MYLPPPSPNVSADLHARHLEIIVSLENRRVEVFHLWPCGLTFAKFTLKKNYMAWKHYVVVYLTDTTTQRVGVFEPLAGVDFGEAPAEQSANAALKAKSRSFRPAGPRDWNKAWTRRQPRTTSKLL